MFQLYNEARELCLQVYGECSLLMSRLYINIGIVYEDNNDYVKAFNYFMRWARVSEMILGPQHPKTLRAKGVLKEPRYNLVAERLKEQDNLTPGRTVGDNQEVVIDEESINNEVSELLEYNSDESTYDDNIIGSDAVTREDVDVDIDEHTGNNDMLQVTAELQQAINQLLRRALGELSSTTPVATLQLDNRLEHSDDATEEEEEDEETDEDTETED